MEQKILWLRMMFSLNSCIECVNWWRSSDSTWTLPWKWVISPMPWALAVLPSLTASSRRRVARSLSSSTTIAWHMPKKCCATNPTPRLPKCGWLQVSPAKPHSTASLRLSLEPHLPIGKITVSFNFSKVGKWATFFSLWGWLLFHALRYIKRRIKL